jgi:hypothetical protein
MTKLLESLRPNDLEGLIKKVFEVDSYRSKIGDDEDVVVVSFTVDGQEPAKDLENFIEMGYDFVLDADVTSGETDDGFYKVFAELERSRHVPEQIIEMLDGINRINGGEKMRFRYFKGFKSQEATEENLAASIPLDKNSYKIATEKNVLENFSNFFSNSYLEELNVIEENIKFKKAWANPISFKIITSGPKADVYESIKGPIMLENKDMAEVMFLTKYIGNYNITKVGNKFIFENGNWAVTLERL